MAYQSIPPVPGELTAERYVDEVVRKGFEKPVRVPTMEDQRAIKSTCLDAVAQTSDFKTVMGYYTESPYAVNTLPAGFDIGATHEWSEVIDMAQQAQGLYNNRAKGVPGSATRLFRFLGKNAPAIEPWIELLPNGDYSSLICGALKIGLSLVNYRTDLCDKIFKTFDMLHDMQLRIKETMELYPEDFKMRELAVRTYVCLLAMIQAMILKLVNEKTFRKFLEAISRKEHGKRSNGNMTSQEKEDQFYNTVEELEKHATYLDRKTSRSTQKEVAKLGYHTSIITTTSARIYSGFMEQDVKISEGFAQIQSTQGKARDEVLSAIQALEGEFREKRDNDKGKWDSLQADVQDQVSRMCLCHHQEHEYNKSLRYPHVGISTPAPNNFVRKRLLRQLHANDVRAAEELAATSKVPLLLEGPFHAHIQNLLLSQRLRAFFSTHDNAILPLTCATEPYGAGLFSPLSIVAKAIVDAIITPPQQHSPSYNNNPPPPPNIHALHFFAGFHTAPGDLFFGPGGLISSLLVQLLNSPSLLAEGDVSDEAKRFHQQDIDATNVGALCELFSGLVRKLPDGTVLVIVIDGLHLFAQNEDVERSTRLVVAALEAAVRDVAWQATLKVVFTFCGTERLTSGEPLRLEGEGGGLDDEEEGEEEDEGFFGEYEEPLRGLVDGTRAGLAFARAVGIYEIPDDFD